MLNAILTPGQSIESLVTEGLLTERTISYQYCTRRPASADRTARRQFQATGQPVNRTQASDAMTSRLPRYEAKCVQRRCFQCGSVPLRSDIKGTDSTELPPANILIPRRKAIDCATTLPLRVFLMNLFSRHFVVYCRNCPKYDKFRYFILILRKPVSSSC